MAGGRKAARSDSRIRMSECLDLDLYLYLYLFFLPISPAPAIIVTDAAPYSSEREQYACQDR